MVAGRVECATATYRPGVGSTAIRPHNGRVSGGAHLDLVRGVNDASVLSLARRGEPMSRHDLAAALDVTPQAMTKILVRLRQRGLIVEAGSISAGPGKPATLYALVPGARRAIGVHVSRTLVRAVVVDLAGRVLDRADAPIGPGTGPEALVCTIVDLARSVRGSGTGQLVGIGVGMPGPTDHDHGVFRGAEPGDPWQCLPLRTELIARLELPALVDHDSTAAVVGESWAAPHAVRDAAFVLVEDGIGAGLRLADVLQRGVHANAGEVGHTVVVLDGEPCACGRRGCAQAEHAAALARGDVARAARIIASVVVDLVVTLDVDRVVLGGSTVRAHHGPYLDAVRAALLTDLPTNDWQHVEVLVSTYGDDAIAVGAAAEVLEDEFGVPAALSRRV